MKRIFSFILTIAIATSFTACGCTRNTENETTAPTSNTTNATTAPTTMPDILPTMDTNIPDPNVDTQMPIYTDGMDEVETTDTTKATEENK